MTDDHTKSDTAFLRLHAAGWSIGETAFSGPAGSSWLVSGSNGENLIRATGRTQTEAWAEAERQAAELGMLDGRVGRASLEN